MAVTKRVAERMTSALKRMLPILLQQRARDVSEADTVTLVKDLLADVFGYNKYADLTGELCIRGTYCDLAIKIEDKFQEIVEVKAIGINLDDRHVKQAVDYAANQGIEWVILTNAIVWRMYHVIFEKPIDKRLIAEIDLTQIDLRNEADLEKLFVFSKEGYLKGAHAAMRDRQDATSRFVIAALLAGNGDIHSVIRRELRRIVDTMVPEEDILQVLKNEVIKRDTLEGPAAEAAAQKVKDAEAKALREQARVKSDGESGKVKPTEAALPFADVPAVAVASDQPAE
jgi:hypothetical protein